MGIKRLGMEKTIEKRFSSRKKQNLHRLERVALIIATNAVELKKIQAKILSALSLSKNQLVCVVFEDSVATENEKVTYFSEKDFNWRGVLKKGSKLNHFLTQDFDLLINYFSEDDLALQWVSASADAKLKVGLPHNEKRLNDIEVVVKKENSEVFISELKKYVNIITG